MRDDLPTVKLNRNQPTKKIKPLMVVMIALELISLTVAGFFLFQYLQVKDKVSTASEQTQTAKNNVSKLLKIYETEEPTIATVKDVETLKKENPEFYKLAKNGDILLIYTKRAILYSPEENIIVNVAPILPNMPTPTLAPTLTPTATTTPTKK